MATTSPCLDVSPRASCNLPFLTNISITSSHIKLAFPGALQVSEKKCSFNRPRGYRTDNGHPNCMESGHVLANSRSNGTNAICVDPAFQSLRKSLAIVTEARRRSALPMLNRCGSGSVLLEPELRPPSACHAEIALSNSNHCRTTYTGLHINHRMEVIAHLFFKARLRFRYGCPKSGATC